MLALYVLFLHSYQVGNWAAWPPAPAWLSHMGWTAQGTLSHVRSHPGGTHVLCNAAGTVYPFKTKLKICLNWLIILPYPSRLFVSACVCLQKAVYIVLHTICYALWSTLTHRSFDKNQPQVWVKHAFVWHVIFSLICDLEIGLKRPWFRRLKLGEIDFGIFQRKNSLFQEFISNMVGESKGKIRWLSKTFVFSDHPSGFLCLNLNTVRFQGVFVLKLRPPSPPP